MDLKAKRESLSKQYNDLTNSINKSLDMRSRVLGALELLHQIMGNCKKCEHGCHCSNGGSCTSCECKDCDCHINATQDEELKPQYENKL